MKIILLLSCIILAACHSDIIIDEPSTMPIPAPSYEDSVWITAQGRGSSQKLAMSDAWRQAMEQYIQDNADTAYYQRNREKITTYIVENWRSYVIGDPEAAEIIKRFDNRRITINANIKGKIIYDVYQIIH